MIVAACGVVLNGGTALLFARGRKGDVNARGAYLHNARGRGRFARRLSSPGF